MYDQKKGCLYALIGAIVAPILVVILLSICHLLGMTSVDVLHIGNPPQTSNTTPPVATPLVTPIPTRQPAGTPSATERSSFSTWIGETWASLTSSGTVQYWAAAATIITSLLSFGTWLRKKLKR